MKTREKEDPFHMAFRLPPDITVSKKDLPLGLAFVFRHKKMGELGRLLVQDIGGQTQISSEVVGDPADPMTKKRQAILEPLTRELRRELDRLTGKPGRTVPPLQSPKEPGQVVASRLLQCNHCNAYVAMLIFAEDAHTPDRLEDYARLMYAKVAEFNLPAWVIGSPLGPEEESPAYILKIWPSRKKAQCLRPEEFKPVLEKLQATHCV